MRFQEVYGDWQDDRLPQEEAALILGVSDRTFRRYIDRFEESGLDGLADKRLTQASRRRAPVDEVIALVDLYSSRHQGWNAQHFHDWYSKQGGRRGYRHSKTRDLIRALKSTESLRKLCGFMTLGDVPSESTFSRAFAQFAESDLGNRVHGVLVKDYLSGEIIGHMSRDANAQVAVDTESKLIVAAHITQQSNDKQELEPTLKNLAALPNELGTTTELLADSGYYSETNVNTCTDKGITPYIAVDRQSHNRSLWERFKEPPPLPDDADSVTSMKHRLKTKAGKAVYALRKVTSEPVFGIIKAVMGIRGFMLRGKESDQENGTLPAWHITSRGYMF